MSTETDHSQTSTHLEQRLRRELDHVTVQVPPDMITRAHRAYRRRLLTTRVTAVTGTAAVIAVTATVLAMTTPSRDEAPGSQRPSPATSQPRSAGELAAAKIPAASLQPAPPGDGLTAQQAAADIAWTRTLTTPAGSATMVSSQFAHGGTTRTISYAADGSPLADDQVATVTEAHGSTRVTTTHVGYQQHAWSRSTTGHKATPGHRWSLCLTAQDYGVALISASVLISSAGSLLACRDLTITRGVRIDGIDAVTISNDVLGTRDTLWLNAATSLPIESTAIPDHPHTPGTFTTTVQFGFLPSAPASLAYLSAYIPPGFDRLSSPLATSSAAA